MQQKQKLNPHDEIINDLIEVGLVESAELWRQAYSTPLRLVIDEDSEYTGDRNILRRGTGEDPELKTPEEIQAQNTSARF